MRWSAEVGIPYAVILVDDESGERVVLWDRPGPLALDAAELPRALIESARLLHVDDVDVAAAIEAARIARDAGVPVTSDIDTMSDLTRGLVQAVSIPIFAEHIPRELTGEADFERALRRIRSYHQGRLCVTLGARGAMMLDGDRLHVAPALAVRTVDSTGRRGRVPRRLHPRVAGGPPSRRDPAVGQCRGRLELHETRGDE